MFKKVGVVGLGLMGSGITQVCAQKGYSVVARELTKELLDKGANKIKDFFTKGVERGKISKNEMETILNNIQFTTSYDDFKECEIVVEAVPEKMEMKKEVFTTLDRITPSYAILASNTSSLSISELASSTKRPDRVVGIHFFNPVPIMKLVELVRGIQTSDDTLSKAKAFAESLGKVTITAKDNPGFIVNFLLIPYLLDAVRALENGIGTKEDIDNGMKIGCNHPMGPLELLDFVGIDTTYYIAEAMYEEYKDPKYAPPPLLKRMVLAGWHGRKSGRGFYTYK